MRPLIVLASLALAVPATAKPLPAGQKVTLKNGRPYLQERGVTVPLRDDALADFDKLVAVELSDDGKAIVVRADRCHGMFDSPDESTTSLAKLEARVENALGMAVHVKKQYPEAIKHFTLAAAGDPDTAVYATNLLSAQSLGNKLDDADKTLDAYGPRNAPWFVWRLGADPELKAVRDRPRAKALAAAKPGHAKSAQLDDDGVAFSPLAGGLVAMLVTSFDGGGPDSGSGSALSIVGLSSGRELLRMDLILLEEACDPDPASPGPCSKKTLARLAERRRAADQVLAALGFDKVPGTFQTGVDTDTMTSPDGKTKVTSDADKLTVVRDGKTRSVAIDDPIWAIAFLPQAVVVKLRRRHLHVCDDESGMILGAGVTLP